MTVVDGHKRGTGSHGRVITAGRTDAAPTASTPVIPAVVPGPGGFPFTGSDFTGSDSFPQVPPQLPVPRLSAGLQLHGEYQGSGFTEPKYIARRGDGQVVQLSQLLYLVASAIDGAADTAAIALRVSVQYGREVSAENILYLTEKKLEPLGVTVPFGQDSDEVDAPRSDLLLSLKGHRVLFTEPRVEKIARALAWLHRPLVVACVLAAAVAMDIWLFGYYGAMTPVLHALDQPVLLLVVFALTVASLVFHEFGHASACRYGGAHPGCIGCGLFLIWPSLYTDVTDVYRIGRTGRIRTDLGGVYFNVVFMLGMAGAYFLTGQQFFLSAIYLGHFEILEQLMPAVRLDGYYILGDLAGVPDLYGKIKPILVSMIPGRPLPPAVADLKRSARIIVTCWVVTMIPLLLADLGYALWNLPRLLATGVRSLTEQLTGTYSAFADGHLASGLVGVLGSLMLVCPLAGMAYLSIRLGGRLIRTAVRTTRGSRAGRTTVLVLALAGVAALSYAWVNGITPKPLPPQPPIAPALQPGVPTAPAQPSSSPPPQHRPHTPVLPNSPKASPITSPSSSPSPSASSEAITPQPSATPAARPAPATPSPYPASPSPSRSPSPSLPSPTPSKPASASPSPQPSPRPSTPPTGPPPTPSPTPAPAPTHS
jgi:putative peptide zinc metalloprotease protein